MRSKLLISTSNELVRISPTNIVYISSDGNYSALMQVDGESRMLSYQLGQLEKIFGEQLGKESEIFIRIGKGIIINRSYIYYYQCTKTKIDTLRCCHIPLCGNSVKRSIKTIKRICRKGDERMSEYKEIRDDQIRVIRGENPKKTLSRKQWMIILSVLIILLVGLIIWAVANHKQNKIQQLQEPEPALFEPVEEPEPMPLQWLGNTPDSATIGYTEIKDTVINDIPIRIYIPHNAELSLHIGRMNQKDTTVIYAAQAADVRADNGGIVGAFVLKGEPKAWGLSKKGYCASINGQVTIGVADNSPLFEQATEEGGYFFRQYPLVSNGEIVENELKGKSIRRGICERQGEIFMVETGTTESFHDFSQALVDLHVNQAVYLVGSSAYGWAVDKAGIIHEFGDDNYYTGRRKMPKNTSYIVWRRK